MEPQHLEELENIDLLLTQILTTEDHRCAPQNSAPWSPALNQAYLRHRLCTITLSAKRTKRDLKEIITSIRKKLILTPDDDEAQHRSISANLRRAQKDLCKAKHEAAELQKKHLEAVLNDARAANQRKKSKALTHLIRAEQNRRCYAAFRQHTKPRSPGGLAYLKTTNPTDQSTTMILDPDEMNETLLDYSCEHFTKAQGSPFTIEPLNHLLNYDGITPFGNQVLRGRADLSNLNIDEATRAIMQHLRTKQPLDSNRDHPLLYDELQKGIKKWPEMTTTSPSGRHLGIYKSLQRHVKEKSPNSPRHPPKTQ